MVYPKDKKINASGARVRWLLTAKSQTLFENDGLSRGLGSGFDTFL